MPAGGLDEYASVEVEDVRVSPGVGRSVLFVVVVVVLVGALVLGAWMVAQVMLKVTDKVHDDDLNNSEVVDISEVAAMLDA